MKFFRNFFKKHKKEIIIFVVCLIFKLIFLSGILYYDSFHSGIENSINMKMAQPAPAIISGLNFHEPGDEHPPLYYAFAATIKILSGGQIWLILLIQDILISLAAVFIYKIGKIIFGDKVGFWAAIIFAVEPFMSFEMNLLISEGVFILLFTLFIYYFSKFIYEKKAIDLIFSSVFLGLATLTRGTTLYFAIFPSTFLIWLILRKFPVRTIIKSILIFNIVFAAIITPWMTRNKIVHGDFTIGYNFGAQNFYFYNLPTLMSVREQISFEQASKKVHQWLLSARLPGEKLQEFYGRKTKEVLAEHPLLYTKIHLIKTIPFFFQPGYEDIMVAFDIKPKTFRPDITLGILQGNIAPVIKFFGQMDFYNYVYFLGLAVWIAVNVFLLLGFYFCFKNKGSRLLFAIFSILTIFYIALPSGTIALARYRLPVYSLFFTFAIFGYFEIKDKFKKPAYGPAVQEKLKNIK